MKSILKLPPVLASKLAEFRRRVWLIKLAEGVLAGLFGLALSYLLVLALDRFFDTPAWLRTVLLVLGAAVPGLGLPLQWHKWVWRHRRIEDAARLLQWKFPRLGDQLLGIVELARNEHGNTGRSERLVQAAMAQADEAVKDQDFSNAVPHAKHRQWGWAAGAACLVTVAGFVTINEAAQNALARWLMPWRNTERFTFARVEALPNPLVVPIAEPFTLPVQLQKETRWSPSSALGSISGQPEIVAPQAESGYQLNFPPQKDDAEMFVKVGDVRQSIRVEPRPRPELTGLKVRMKLPDYLKYETQPETDIRGGSLSVLKGAQATFEATASRTLTTAEIDGKPAKMDGDRLTSEALPIDEARSVSFTWKDNLGLTARVPLVLQVQTAEDQAPKIVARRETMEQVVLDSEVVTFDVNTSDDFGVKQVGLSWKGINEDKDAKQTVGSKIVSDGGPEKKEVAARATFCATREGIAPQTLEIRAWADDFMVGRERTQSVAFLLHVLNREDHALWVTQQMGKWLEAARETYEREQQLHQTNKELRDLSAEDLDRTENRRKIAQQAASENANAERLNSLNNAGRNMVEQATKNPEFDAARLESWATMLKSLQDIAANRMPSVSDLLKQSADAKADGKLAAGSPGKPGAAKPSEPGKPGEGKPGDPNTPPSESKPGSPGKPSDGKSAPQLALGSPPPAAPGEAKPADPNAKPKEPVPSIKITESTMNKPEPKEEKPEEPGAPKPPGKSKFGLPGNSLAAAPGAKPEEKKPEDPSSAQQPLDQGVQEQRDLLAEFAKVSDQLSEILASLEASTFVKRLKLASREQTQLASGISQKTLDAFGIVKENEQAALSSLPEDTSEAPAQAAGGAGAGEAEEEPDDADEIPDGKVAGAKPAPAPEPTPQTFVTTYAPEANTKAKSQSGLVKIIQNDLEAYTQRKPDQHFKNVLGEMKKTRIVKSLEEVGTRVTGNFNGNAIHGAEFWADTLDRWAEEMVKAGKCSKCSSCKGDSLPPEIVLKVMQALRDEMKLRDETRELENARTAMEADEHREKSRKLSKEQDRIGEHTNSAVEDILGLPQGEEKFGKELKLLAAVGQVMTEASDILRAPDTGAPAVAAESEAIELLLQTKRQNPNGGGGGGSDPGGGSTAGSASSAALAELGPGSDAKSAVTGRPVGQATGRAGREFPEEFKTGLDAYFSNLEGTGGRP